MKIYTIIILLIFSCTTAVASVSPRSGQFSNFTKSAIKNNYQITSNNKTLNTQINLVVTKNSTGQQFFLQCSNGTELGFGVITKIKNARSKTIINAGQFCPFKVAEVEFDYDWVILKANNKTTLLYQGSISVPIVE